MKCPEWLKPVPLGLHGTGPIQKKTWKLISDIVRIEQWHKYGPRCISCGRVLESWKDGQAAHYIPWSTSNHLFKFNRRNLGLSCAHCNHVGGMNVGHAFAQALASRGIDADELERENRSIGSQRLYDDEVLALATSLLDLELPEYPDYWYRVKERLDAITV